MVTWLKMIGGPLNVLFAVRKTAGKKKKPQKSCFQGFFFFYHIRQLWISSHKNNQSKTLLYSTVIIIMRSKKYIFLLIGSFDFLRYKSLSHRVGRGGERAVVINRV